MMPQTVPHNGLPRFPRPSATRSARSAPADFNASIQDLGPARINPIQWHQAIGYARTQCARIFRDGGGPDDALKAFSLKTGGEVADWSQAVTRIAMRLCTPTAREDL